jgi:hypothetical protein
MPMRCSISSTDSMMPPMTGVMEYWSDGMMG